MTKSSFEVKIAPSLLSADFSRLADEVRDSDAAGAEVLHLDVMDGHFVPNLTIGPAVVSAIRKHTKSVLDVHLMVTNPEKYIEPFAKSGADWISFHIEVCPDAPEKNVDLIRKYGKKAGVVLNPGTPAESVRRLAGVADFVLVMSVWPGFGGQRFIPDVLPKIAELRGMFGAADVEVDGGINAATAFECASVGANVFVAGTSVFGEKDRASAVRAIRDSASKGLAGFCRK